MLARMAAHRRHCCSAVGNFAHDILSRHRWVRRALQRATRRLVQIFGARQPEARGGGRRRVRPDGRPPPAGGRTSTDAAADAAGDLTTRPHQLLIPCYDRQSLRPCQLRQLLDLGRFVDHIGPPTSST